MHTKDKLANALRNAGLDAMAKLAADGMYHDFLSPLPDPATALERQLWAVLKQWADDAEEAALAGNKEEHDRLKRKIDEVAELRSRHLRGEFDASSAESDDWARSPEGQRVLGSLLLREKK